MQSKLLSFKDASSFTNLFHQEKTPVDAYYETFGLTKRPSVVGINQLGAEHLINEDDRTRLKNVSNQIKSYLDEITEENPSDGFLSTKIADQIAGKLSQEMQEFS